MKANWIVQRNPERDYWEVRAPDGSLWDIEWDRERAISKAREYFDKIDPFWWREHP